MKDMELIRDRISTSSRKARLVHTIGKRQIWAVSYAYLGPNGGTMVIEDGVVESITPKNYEPVDVVAVITGNA